MKNFIKRLAYKFLKNKISLKVYLTISFAFLSIVPLIVCSYVYYGKIKKSIDDDAIKASEKILGYISTNVDKYLNEIDDTCMEVLLNSNVIDYFIKKPKDDKELYKKRRQLLEELQKVDIYRHFQSIMLYPDDGYMFSIGALTESSIDDYKEYSVYKDAIKAKGDAIFVPLHEYKGKDAVGDKREVFSYAKSLNDLKSGNLLGVIEITFEEKEISSIISNSSRNSSSKIYLVSEDSKVVAGTDPNQIGRMLPECYSEIIRQNIDWKIVQTGEGKKLAITKSLEDTNWKLLEEIDYDNLIQRAKEMKSFFVGAILIVASLVTLIIIVAIFALTSSIKKITDALLRIKDGSMECKTGNIYFSELDYIGSSIKEMAKRISELISDIIRQQTQKRVIELKMLQAQITPHFLYNMLHSISCMARNRKEEDIAASIDALIKLLKMAVSVKTDLITVKEELEIAECYLLLERTRSSNRFTFDYSIGSGLDGCKIPKMVLQPIVENCIMHGFVGTKDDYEIKLLIEEIEENVFIKVFDNGEGMGKDKIEAAMGHSAYEKRNRFSGIGLENVNQKIKLYFGERYGLNIVSEKSEGTLVSVCIPKLFNEGSGEHAQGFVGG